MRSNTKAKVIFLSGSMRLSGSATWMNTLIDAFEAQGIECIHIITGKKTSVKSRATISYYTGRPAKMFPTRLYRLFRLHKWSRTCYRAQEMRLLNKKIKQFCLNKLDEKVLVIKDFTAYLPSYLESPQFVIAAVIHQQFTEYEERFPYNHLLTVSNTVKKHSNALGFEIDEVIYNPINADMIIERSDEFLPTEKNYILFVGSLIKEKGVFELLEAYHQLLVEKQVNCQLVFVGEGKARVAIEDYIKRHKLGEEILLKGFLTNPYPYIKRAKLLVLPSYSEAMAYVVMEAAMLKTAFVTSNFASASEFYSAKNIFDMGSTEQEFIRNLKDKLLEMLAAPEYRIKPHVLDKIKSKKIVESYIKLLSKS